jgi:hypothetical protein
MCWEFGLDVYRIRECFLKTYHMEDQETYGRKILTLIAGMDRKVGRQIQRYIDR